MKSGLLSIAIVSVCIFAVSAISSYIFNDESISDSDSNINIEALENEIVLLKEQIQVLEKAETLMPVERNWMILKRIIDSYPDLVWRASEVLEISTDTENAWRAVMIASPDLLLPVMRLIQKEIPAEISEIQLDKQQGILLVNILGVLQ